MSAVKILDTTIGENGPEQSIDYAFLRSGTPLRFSVDISAGDSLVIYGRDTSDDDWNVLHTFTDSVDAVKDIYPSRSMKASRTVDGAVGDSEIFIANPFLLSLTEHAA